MTYDIYIDTDERGVDYDLRACLTENPQTFTVDDIARVLAVSEGENDERDWRWVLQLQDGRYAFVQGGCDYTGWDCQSWATSAYAETAEAAARLALGDIPAGEKGPQDAGMGHMLAMLSGEFMDDAQGVYADLLHQIAEGKGQTRRESVGVALNAPEGASDGSS